ncbi:MAG: hypothetical protein OK422_03870 [Thaumarchaeota archaeon]|nr:hypothetical protein [Nitrososphaerota archaeon]
MDFGETLMNPFTLHQSAIITETYKELGRESEAGERVKKWYALRDSFGSHEDPTHQRVRLLKQYAKERVYSEVLENDRRAIQLFEEKERNGFTPTEGLGELLTKLRDSDVSVAVVSESASLPAVMVIARFLSQHDLGRYFRELITPAGRFSVSGVLLDERFVGKTKKDQTIYDTLRAYLEEQNFRISECAMVGDDPVLDVEYAKLRGFAAIQYTGVIDRGYSTMADYIVDNWNEFPQVTG